MPFALVIIGLVMIVTGSRDTYAAFGAQLRRDFTGPGNFTFWLASLGAVGTVGYIPRLKPLSVAFMSLIIVAMLLSNRGFFTKLQEALNHGPVASPRSGNTVTTGDGVTITTTPSAGRTQAETDQINAAEFGTTGRGIWADLSAIGADPIGLPLRRLREWLLPDGINFNPTQPLEPDPPNPMQADPNPFDTNPGILPNAWF